ncbi:MAG: helix-turn-helix transcriptional regulator [Rhizobiales bacterium]|nr:helix-turn-helix transcriptional regulator [Hyphomicrobiales bacterium]
MEKLIETGQVAVNLTLEKYFNTLMKFITLQTWLALLNCAPRQLQRNLNKMTGFTPHDFLKVLRLQQSLNGEDTWSYADQSYFIHSFRKATGYTPEKYSKNLMSEIYNTHAIGFVR